MPRATAYLRLGVDYWELDLLLGTAPGSARRDKDMFLLRQAADLATHELSATLRQVCSLLGHHLKLPSDWWMCLTSINASERETGARCVACRFVLTVRTD
ncbi:hypothetical protein GCM10027161_62460 [Microbispora hainanensis]